MQKIIFSGLLSLCFISSVHAVDSTNSTINGIPWAKMYNNSVTAKQYKCFGNVAVGTETKQTIPCDVSTGFLKLALGGSSVSCGTGKVAVGLSETDTTYSYGCHDGWGMPTTCYATGTTCFLNCAPLLTPASNCSWQ